MKVWAISNQKGGVGKTTTTVTLGGLLTSKSNRVLLVDTDPSSSMTYYFGINSEELEVSLYDLFMQGKEITEEEVLQILCPSTLKGLDILPATMALSTLDRSFGAKGGMGLVLKRALDLIADHYDYAVLDCPPIMGVLTVNALAASDRILIPVQTEFLALKGLDRMLRTMEIMEQSQSEGYKYTIVPTMFDKRTKASLETYRKLRDLYGENVWNGVIPVDTKFRDASLAQTPPSVFCPKSRGVFAYDTLLSYLDTLDS